jgi:hypothetical protein
LPAPAPGPAAIEPAPTGAAAAAAAATAAAGGGAAPAPAPESGDDAPPPGPPLSAGLPCGINSSPDAPELPFKYCKDDLEYLDEQHPDATGKLLCKGYGKEGDTCTLSLTNNAHGQYGMNLDPSSCNGNYLWLWDEPYTQAAVHGTPCNQDANAADSCSVWVANRWKEYVAKWGAELTAARSKGLKVASPQFTEHGNVLTTRFQKFFAACPECNQAGNNAFIDAIQWNAWYLPANGAQAGQEDWIMNKCTELKQAVPGKLCILGNYGYLGGKTPQDQINVIQASKLYDPATNGDVDTVYYFNSKDYGGGTMNNHISQAGNGGLTIGAALIQKCSR